MEVMNSIEFEQKDVLVGGSGKTGKFTVNDDPHLMSMLSTSLYANPLKTMIQEIMFNAWDAHRMGNCQDKPIDVYINDTTGLIVRDYGPGIQPTDIDQIYCTYGNSTKRDDPNQTGGFGLGSKSPYAYNDSFMVTNHYSGLKSMYIMRRVHDDNDGGPGYDHVVDSVPTEESGLLVTVPIKSESDKQRAYKYMKEILFLSGIKVNIHYEGSDEDDELVEAESLAPGEFIYSNMENSGIFAVYGGVKYKIPEHDEYLNEFNFVSKLSRKLGAFYIGFAPNTLTPLPNREGLNMRERSVESIQTQLETIQEHFMGHMIPAAKATMLEVLRSAKSSTLQPQFLIYQWKRVGDGTNMKDMMFEEDPIMELIESHRSPDVNASIWTSLVKLCLEQSHFMCEMIGYDKFFQLKSLIWAKELPEYRDWRYQIADTRGLKKQNILVKNHTNYCKWLIDTQKKIEEITNAENKPRVRYEHGGSNWLILTNLRRAGKVDHIQRESQKRVVAALALTNKLKTPNTHYPDCLWFQKDGKPFNNVTMKHGTIILAKTATALAQTDFYFQKLMVPRLPNTYDGYNKWNWQNWVDHTAITPIAAFVVHRKKDGYDKVKAMLEAEGYTIIEADEPEVKTRTVKSADDPTVEVVEKLKGYPVVNYYNQDWEGHEYIQKPSTYLYCTKTDLGGYDKPYREDMVGLVQKYAPKMVMVHNKRVADKLRAAGALSYEERIEKIVDDLMNDKDRVKLLRLYSMVHDEAHLPKEILRIGEIQKLFGLPYLRTSQIEKFERDLEMLKAFNTQQNNYYYRRCRGVQAHLTRRVRAYMDELKNDDSVVMVRQMVKNTRLFDESALRSIITDMKRGEQKMFSQKLIRFLRTV